MSPLLRTRQRVTNRSGDAEASSLYLETYFSTFPLFHFSTYVVFLPPLGDLIGAHQPGAQVGRDPAAEPDAARGPGHRARCLQLVERIVNGALGDVLQQRRVH